MLNREELEEEKIAFKDVYTKKQDITQNK